MDSPTSPLIIGIDLGTSTSEAAYLKAGKPALIKEVRGATHGILPSVVGIGSRGDVVIGEPAESLLIPKPQFAVAEVKRLMGTAQRVRLGDQEYTPQEISARILRHLKEEAERFLGRTVEEAVITVPANFDELQRRATRDAGEIAGLRVRRLINEPTAAALAYGIERPGVEEKVVVYDLGGGTLDVTVLELSEGILDVLASTGDTRLGGKEFDERLMNHLQAICRRETGVDLFASVRFRQRLKVAAKKAKEELSSVEATEVVLDNIGQTADGEPIDFFHTVTRQEFESLIRDLVETTREYLDEALAVKQLDPGEIGTILLVGGSTRIPLVRGCVSEYFGGRQLRTEVDPQEAVALGAAVLAGMESRLLDPGEIIITDVSPFTFGVAIVAEGEEGELIRDVFDPLIRKNTTVPRTVKKTYRTMVDFQERVHVRIFQGDAAFCDDNTFVGDFYFEELPPAPAGEPLEIEMSYNLNGEVEAVALAPRTGRSLRHRIRYSQDQFSQKERERAASRLQEHWSGGQSPPPPPAAAPVDPEAWRSSPSYPRVAPLLSHAESRLASLEPEVRVRVDHLLNQIKGALATGDQATLARAEGELTDVLFDLE
jgi:molecular chaperone DnaK